jgi:hypothetical protein
MLIVAVSGTIIHYPQPPPSLHHHQQSTAIGFSNVHRSVRSVRNRFAPPHLHTITTRIILPSWSIIIIFLLSRIFSQSDIDENAQLPIDDQLAPPTFALKPQTMSGKVGDLITYRCRINGTQPIGLFSCSRIQKCTLFISDICWYNNNRELVNHDRYRIYKYNDEHRLDIFDIEMADAGEIVCLAINQLSMTLAAARLEIEGNIPNLQSDISFLENDIAGESPEFIYRLDDIVAIEGEHIRLCCTLSGNPTPRVTFYRNNKPICTDKRIDISKWMIVVVDQLSSLDRTDTSTWTLTLQQSTVDDTGQWSATAINRIGTITCKCTLSVIRKSKPRTNFK